MPQEGALVGQTLEGYRLRKLLGVGGMAEVYLAEEPSLRRDVAVKVLPRLLATDPNYVARFRDEARHVAGLSHPNIVPVYTFGEDRGLLYLVMPLLKESLRDRMEREGLIASKEAGRIAYSIASALHTAHHYGIVHRDVKPENILMDGDNKPMLTDFGIAREIDALREDGVARTLAATGLPVGTPEYMAPEQLRGLPATPQVDLYALGAVLYEMLTARVPHDASTPYEVASAVLRDPVIPPSRINPAVTPALERVVLTAMAREPENRYPDMRAFALDLRDALSGRSATTNTLRWTRFIPASRGGPSALPTRPLEGAEDSQPATPSGSTTKRATLAAMVNPGARDVAGGAGALGAVGALGGAGIIGGIGGVGGMGGSGRSGGSGMGGRDGMGRTAANAPGVAAKLPRSLQALWPAGKRPTPLILGALAAALVTALIVVAVAASAVSGMLASGAPQPTLPPKALATTAPTATATTAPTATARIVVITATPGPTATPAPAGPQTLVFSETTITLSQSYQGCQAQNPLTIQNFNPKKLTWHWDSSSFDKLSNARWKLDSGSYINFNGGGTPSATLSGYSGGSTAASNQLWLRASCTSGTYPVTFTDSTGRSYTLQIVFQG